MSQKPQKKTRQLVIRIDDDLYAQSRAYAEKRGTTVAAIVRATLRRLANPRHPQRLPRGIADEVRPSPRERRTKPESKP